MIKTEEDSLFFSEKEATVLSLFYFLMIEYDESDFLRTLSRAPKLKRLLLSTNFLWVKRKQGYDKLVKAHDLLTKSGFYFSKVANGETRVVSSVDTEWTKDEISLLLFYCKYYYERAISVFSSKLYPVDNSDVDGLFAKLESAIDKL